MQRFLIIQTAFLGDVILATPVVSELKRIYPDAAIDVLVRKGNEGILAHHPAIRTVFTLNKKQGKNQEIKRLVGLFRKERYDEAINLQRFGSSGLITWLSGAKKKVGFDKNPFSFCYAIKVKHAIGTGIHEVERNLLLIAHHGAKPKVRPAVYPGEAEFAAVEPYIKEPFFCLAPASVWFTKQLPENKWVELAQLLQRKGTVYLVGGPGDFDLCERIRTAAGLPETANLAGKLSLLASCALFSKAKRCYVNDSGPLHMASAVNAPTTAFFCATVPRFGFGPLSDDSTISETPLDLVCRPCGLHGGKACPEGHFKCGTTIRVVTDDDDEQLTVDKGQGTVDNGRWTVDGGQVTIGGDMEEFSVNRDQPNNEDGQPLVVDFTFSRKSFLDNCRVRMELALRSNGKQIRNYGIAAVLVTALAAWQYLTNDHKLTALVFIAGFLLAVELYLIIGRLVYRNKYESKVLAMAEDLEVRQMNCTWILSETFFGYRDKDQEYELKWEAYSGYSLYGKSLVLWRRDLPDHSMVLDLEHASLTKALAEKIVAIIQSKLANKPVK